MMKATTTENTLPSFTAQRIAHNRVCVFLLPYIGFQGSLNSSSKGYEVVVLTTPNMEYIKRKSILLYVEIGQKFQERVLKRTQGWSVWSKEDETYRIRLTTSSAVKYYNIQQ